MGNKNTREEGLTSKNEDIQIAIKHFPIMKEDSNINGTLTLTVMEPFKLLFLDPMSQDGQEEIELDMKVKYAGKTIQSEMQSYQRRKRFLRKSVSHNNFFMNPAPILDGSDNSININFGAKVIQHFVPHYEQQGMKYQFKIECQNITKFEHVQINFCMPSLLNKKRLDQVTEFEKPGRVAGTSTISVEDILESRQCIPVVSSESGSQLGAISVSCSFQAKQEINLLDGQKEMVFQDEGDQQQTSCSSTSSGQQFISPKQSCRYRKFNTAGVIREQQDL